MSGLILTPISDFNPNKVSTGSRPGLVRVNFNPNKVLSGAKLTPISDFNPKKVLVQVNFNPNKLSSV